MRMSRVLLVGVAVAGAAVTTSAFTAGNTLSPPDNFAGYGDAVVSGTTVNNIRYNPSGSDPSRLASVVFTSTQDITNTAATMNLTNGGTTVGGTTSTCVVGSFSAGAQPITCTLGTAVLFTAFDGIGLTVVSQ
jgi:hypothetical protein